MGKIENNMVSAYLTYLRQEEKSVSTRKQYEREIRQFVVCVNARLSEEEELSKEHVLQYKESLLEQYKPATINVTLAAINGFLSYIGKPQLRVKQLKIQRNPYCKAEKELTKAEYLRLLNTAKKQGKEQLEKLLMTICGTGIRVSEVQYITAEAVQEGQVTIRLKGKNRVIFISGKLQKALKDYIRQQKIQSGPVFVTRNGNPLDRSNIWKMMKALCKEAKVDAGKVFPHNLRHLFARCFYELEKDIAKLADLLGHSSINTTRIYIVSTGVEHRRTMEALGLVV